MKVLFYTAAMSLFLASGLFAGSPTPVSVTPGSQTYTTTTTTAYTFVASDSDGAGDLLGVDALFGYNYDCWLFYNQQTNQISVWNSNNGGTWTTEAAGQTGAVMYGNACNIDPSTVSASASGNNLSVTVTITLGGSGGPNPIYLSASNVSGTGSPYVQLATYTVQSGASGQFTITISPTEGFIPNGGSTTATVTITDGPGFSGTVNLSLSAFPNGSGLSGSFSPASITGNGSSTLTITSNGESPSSRDPVTVFATTTDGSFGQYVNFVTMIDDGPPTLSFQIPSPNSGSSATFGVGATDNATAETVVGFNLLINSTLDGQNACWMWYDEKTNYLWLASDDASTWNGIVLDGPVTTSNSQCTVGSKGSGAYRPGQLGTTTGMSVVIEFAPGFAGAKNVYGRTANMAGFDTGYVPGGTYTVQ